MRPRVHNVVSYSGALLVFWLEFGWRAGAQGASVTAGLGAALWSVHFARRIAESAFVHRYSKASIAPADYVTEYIYYWGFAAWIAWSLTDAAKAPALLPVQLLGLAWFALAEAGNARAHLMLRALRTPGGREKAIPRGFLFERVSCPHYLFEILSWAGFNLVTQTWAGVAFMLVGAGILVAWAQSRHVAYRKEFDGQDGRELYPVQRRALVPFVF